MGRKSIPLEERRVPLSASISHKLYEEIESLCGEDTRKSSVVECLLKKALFYREVEKRVETNER